MLNFSIKHIASIVFTYYYLSLSLLCTLYLSVFQFYNIPLGYIIFTKAIFIFFSYGILPKNKCGISEMGLTWYYLIILKMVDYLKC